MLRRSFGTGDVASQSTLTRGAGDAKRAGFGLAGRHGAVSSEKAVVLTDFNRFGERRAMDEKCASAGA